MNSLKNKRIIITGGSKGIGLAVARECAKEGANLILAARQNSDLMAAVDSLEGDGEYERFSLDVSAQSDVKEFAEYVKGKFAAIDGVVNCAGILPPVGKTADVAMDSFIKTLHVNFLGTFYMCHYFIPLLNIRAKQAKIVNFAGGGATGPFPRYTAYAASKAAVVRFTENIALEYKDNHIHVNAVAPGFVATGIHEATFAAGEKAAGGFFDITRQKMAEGGVDPDLAAQLTVFLLSSASNGITGKLISANWDPWRDEKFQERLRADKDFATLRRIDNLYFSKRCLWEKIITKLRSLARGKSGKKGLRP